MHPRYHGRVGQVLQQIEEERFKRYKDRPWELRSRAQHGGEFIVLILVIAVVFGLISLLSLL